MAIMLLVHDGKLRYEDRLTDIFPDFPEYGKVHHHSQSSQPYFRPARLRRSDGEACCRHSRGKIPQIKDAGVLEILKLQKTTKFPPGTRWDYSNSGYAVLAMVVEKVSGQPFGDFLHDRIFAPLKMKQTVAYEKGKNTVAHRAYGHTHEGRRLARRWIRARLRRSWVMAGSIPRSMIWPSGTERWRSTLC